MNEKIVSAAKIKANQTNALKSTGAKTARGKSFSRRNALKHGLFSREVLVSDADKPEFDDLRRQLVAQFEPSTVMQSLAFDNVVLWTWRSKLATRLEHRQLASRLEASDPSRAQIHGQVSDAPLSRWYGSDRQSIRAGIKALDYARSEYISLGYFHEDTKEFLSRGFGPGFVETLTQWRPMDKDAALLANMMVAHARNFGDDIYPEGLQPPPTTVLDPQQALHMVGKLLDERRCFLVEILRMRDEFASDAEREERLIDFNPTFLVTATRELRRAVDWFLYLKEAGL